MQVLACSDTTDAWKLIKEIPPRMIDCHRLMDICFKPRVNLNVFDEGTKLLSPTDSPSKMRQDDFYADDSDDESGITSPVLQNDPLKAYEGSSTPTTQEKVKARSYRRGVGSVSGKVIAHYRQLALQERRNRGIPAPEI
jgi:hypothetical protein